MKRFLALALLLAAAACGRAGGPSTPQHAAAGAASVGFAADTSAIFAGDKARELTEPCSYPAPGPVDGTWTPSAAEVAALEPALAALVSEQLQAQFPNDDIAAGAYHRQYGGLIIGGRRVIFVNGFRAPSPDPDQGWRSWPMVICDGGPIQFGVIYDPATRRFSNFSFNGLG